MTGLTLIPAAGFPHPVPLREMASTRCDRGRRGWLWVTRDLDEHRRKVNTGPDAARVCAERNRHHLTGED